MLIPEQIGQIAAHIKTAMDLNPRPPKDDDPVCVQISARQLYGKVSERFSQCKSISSFL